jgi:hypothetical protein
LELWLAFDFARRKVQGSARILVFLKKFGSDLRKNYVIFKRRLRATDIINVVTLSGFSGARYRPKRLEPPKIGSKTRHFLGGGPIFAPLLRLLAKYEAERDKTSTFVDSKSAVHLFVQKITAIAVVVIDIFTTASRPSREKWVHIQHYFQAFPSGPVTFLK